MSRVVYGAVAGFCATMAMTMAMRRLEQSLPAPDRYPLPPREITQVILGSGARRSMLSVAAHFGYGAACGAVYGLLPRALPGIVFGPAIWAASYLGWIPWANILVPATRHPAERNRLMLVAHVVWGGALAVGLRELEAASRTIFRAGRLDDRSKSRTATMAGFRRDVDQRTRSELHG